MDLNSPLYDIQSAFSFLFFLLSAKDRIYNQVCEEMVAMVRAQVKGLIT
jgi:hypothetical protein